MAILIKHGPNAGFLSGRVGDLIFMVRNGKNYIRERRKKPKDLQSERQVLMQQRFGFVQGFAKHFRKAVVLGYRTYGFAAFHKFTSALFGAVSQASEGWRVEMEKLPLSTGGLPEPSEMECAYRQGRLSFKWQPAPERENQEMVLLWCNADGDMTYRKVWANEGRYCVHVVLQEPTYAYAFLTDEELEDSSETVFLGTPVWEGGEA